MSRYLILALLFPAFCFGLETETRELSGFTNITISGGSKVEIQNGDEYQIWVQAADGGLDLVQTRLETPDSLVIEMPEGLSARGGEFLVRLTVPELKYLGLLGSGSVTTGPLEADEIGIALNGSGRIDMAGLVAERTDIKVLGSGDLALGDVTVQSMEAQILGSGDISVTGDIETLELKIAGSGDFGGSDLRVKNLTGNILGSGDADFSEVENDQLRHGQWTADLIPGLTGGAATTINSHESMMHGDGEGISGIWVPLLGVIFIFGGPLFIATIFLLFSYRRKKMLHETLRQYSSGDRPIPPEVLNVLQNQGGAKNNLHSGMVSIAVGAGLAVFFLAIGHGDLAAIGCIPGFIGAAKLAIWKLEKKDQ